MFHKPAHKDNQFPAGQIEWKEDVYLNFNYPTTEDLRLLNEWLASMEELDHNYSYSE